jgi:hypothetical protein
MAIVLWEFRVDSIKRITTLVPVYGPGQFLIDTAIAMMMTLNLLSQARILKQTNNELLTQYF